jgi:hypothetical protein
MPGIQPKDLTKIKGLGSCEIERAQNAGTSPGGPAPVLKLVCRLCASCLAASAPKHGDGGSERAVNECKWKVVAT